MMILSLAVGIFNRSEKLEVIITCDKMICDKLKTKINLCATLKLS